MTNKYNLDSVETELKNDGRLSLLNSFKKPGAPILCFSSIDMDSQMKGGWRWTVCLMETDITDVQAFMEHNPFTHTLDATRWLIFEHTKEDLFKSDIACPKLGYTWNGVIGGALTVYPDGKIGKPNPDDEFEKKQAVYCWYPVK